MRLFYSFRHRARSWNKRRRIVVKIEVGPLGTNVRFVITMTTAESAKIGLKNLNAILAPIGFPAIAIVPTPFGFNSMRSLTNCWCCSVCTPSDSPISLALGWKPYGLSCSRLALDLGVRLVICGFISRRAGPDKTASCRSANILNNCLSLSPVNSRRRPTDHRAPKGPDRPWQGCSSKTRSPSAYRQSRWSSLARPSQLTFELHTMNRKYKFFDQLLNQSSRSVSELTY